MNAFCLSRYASFEWHNYLLFMKFYTVNIPETQKNQEVYKFRKKSGTKIYLIKVINFSPR